MIDNKCYPPHIPSFRFIPFYPFYRHNRHMLSIKELGTRADGRKPSGEFKPTRLKPAGLRLTAPVPTSTVFSVDLHNFTETSTVAKMLQNDTFFAK